MHKFKDLIVWEKGRELVKMVYRLTDKLPDNEKYGLISQINRADAEIKPVQKLNHEIQKMIYSLKQNLAKKS